MNNVVFCGYREWAIQIFDNLCQHPNIHVIDRIRSQQEYLEKKENFSDDIDILLFIGWSWIIPPEITEKYLCIGVHPSDLPNYRGGSPIQNQILNGITKSKVSLMTLSEKLDAGEIWGKEDLDLSGGSITIIFKHITESSIKLLTSFFDKYPNITPEVQDLSKGSYFKRRKPKQSKLTLEDLSKMSLREVYDFIRCLTDPYPNAFLEDDNGNRLYFKEVTYISAHNDSEKTVE